MLLVVKFLVRCVGNAFLYRNEVVAFVYDEVSELDSWDLLEAIGRKRGFLISGGEINMERTALMLLDEFRSAKIGRISLERPE